MTKRKLPKRDLRILQIERRILRLEAFKVAAIRTIVRVENELPSLHKQLVRLRRKPATLSDVDQHNVDVACGHMAEQIKETEDKRVVQEIAEAGPIPDYLQRTPNRDAIIADEIRAEQERIKKAKAAARISKMLANKSGARQAMPLQGKDALKAIMGD